MSITPELKTALVDHLKSLLNQRIQEAEKAISEAKVAKQSETKSSVGDKYETGRAMIQAEQERQEANLYHNQRLYRELEQLPPENPLGKVASGCLIQTNLGVYFISIGIGSVKFQEQSFFVISLSSPIGKVLEGKTIGEAITFNGRDIIVEKII